MLAKIARLHRWLDRNDGVRLLVALFGLLPVLFVDITNGLQWYEFSAFIWVFLLIWSRVAYLNKWIQ